MQITLKPLTAERFKDFEAVFNAPGCSLARGCWCMYYRVSGKQAPLPGLSQRDSNRARMQRLVRSGRVTGLIGYRDGEPVGWVSLGPRSDYAKLARSSVMKPVDSEEVWSIICFVVPAAFRGQGVAAAMLRGAVRFARQNGARLLEAYPVDHARRVRDDSLWFGVKSMYDAEGFVEVARRRPHRPIVRKRLSVRSASTRVRNT